MQEFFKETQTLIEQEETKEINKTKEKIFRKKQIEKDKVLVEKAFRHKKINVLMGFIREKCIAGEDPW